MSLRELKALETGTLTSTRLRSGRPKSALDSSVPAANMTESRQSERDGETLIQDELERLRAELHSKDIELEKFKSSVLRAESKLCEVSQLAEERLLELGTVKETVWRTQDDLAHQSRQVSELQDELRQANCSNELEMLRTTEKLRVEYDLKLQKREEHMGAWIEDLKASHAAEREHLLNKIAELEKVSKLSDHESVESDSCSSEEVDKCLSGVRSTDRRSVVSAFEQASTSDMLQPLGNSESLSHDGFEPPTDSSLLHGGRNLSTRDLSQSHQSLARETSVSSGVMRLPTQPMPTAHASSHLSASADIFVPHQSVVTTITSSISQSVPSVSGVRTPFSMHPVSSSNLPSVVSSSVRPLLPAGPQTAASRFLPYQPDLSSDTRPLASVQFGSSLPTLSVNAGTSTSACSLPAQPVPLGTNRSPVTVVGTRTTPFITASSIAGPAPAPALPASTTDPVVETMTRLLQAQADAMTAQARAAAVQHLPALPSFTGEGEDARDDGFDMWFEHFQERAKYAGWSESDQLYHLKLCLDKTALDVYRVLPDDKKKRMDLVVSALRSRFQPGGIEELRGLEFHHLSQGNESIEQLGLRIQQLGRRAFPTIVGKDFDRLLKGRFYQALLVKWQRRLGAPKADETFNDLYTRARVLEEHEKQYNASAESKGVSLNKNRSDESPKKPSGRDRSKPIDKPVANRRIENQPTNERHCWLCKRTGHLRRDCPTRTEAPGRIKSSKTGAVSTPQGECDMSVDELEQLLAQKRLREEQSKLENSSTSVVSASRVQAGTVGSLLEVTVDIGGVSTLATIDTGAQSTIISRATLHEVVNNLKKSGQEIPKLVLPTVRLYGKDGQKGGHELGITAQVSLPFKLRDKMVTVPVFVQPTSTQPCLLGMNVIPLLGIQVTHTSGEPLMTIESEREIPKESAVTVLLVEAVAIPSQNGILAPAKISCSDFDCGEHGLLFQPNSDVTDLGVTMTECLVSIEKNEIFLPIENPQGVVVHLDAGVPLGSVSALHLPPEEPKDDGLESSSVSTVKTDTSTPERLHALLQVLGLPLAKLSTEEAKQLETLVAEFADVFALDETELGCTHLVEHAIDTGDHQPIRQQPYRTPIVRRQKLNELVADMRAQGIVRPSSSPWASPVVLVPKKDGSLRFCIDYRRLNAITRKDVYPLPRVDDILVALGEAQYFTSLDLASGYWQIGLSEDARQKSAFVTYNGLFEFIRMPFGLCNAPATFQRLMQCVLAGLEYKCCFVYLDDVLVASKTFNDHLVHLREVFSRLRSAQLRLKPKKCDLLRDRVHFLGYVVSPTGIEPDPAKTNKINEFPTPTDATSVRRFLGLASYYRRFVPQFSVIAAPLNQLTKKNVQFKWSEECKTSFERLKAALMSAPVLVYPRFGPGNTFVLETDASLVGLGAVLSQTQPDGSIHPVAYASRSLDKHEKNYGISELETLGLVWAVRYFRPFLLGHPCVVYTDHAACLSILNTKKPSGKLARWALTVQEMDLTIKHKAGKKNGNADALSRCPNPPASELTIDHDQESRVCAVDPQTDGEDYRTTLPDPDSLSSLQRADDEIAPVLVLPEDSKEAHKIVLGSKQFSVVEGVLEREDPLFPSRHCTVVPASLRAELLKEAHQGRFAGHLAEKKVYDRLRRYVWWSGMRRDIHDHCKACLACVSRSGGCRPSKPPLQPIPVGGPFHRVAVDVLQLPLSARGNKYVVVFMDYFTKWPEAFAVSDQSAETIARLFAEEIVCRHGIPEELLSDRGANFLSNLIQELCKILGVKKVNTSGYHPQTDGMVEKFNSTLIGMIAKSCDVRERDWDDHLPFLLFAYRASAQDSTKESPFYLLHGRDPRVPTETVISFSRSPYAVDMSDYKTDLCSSLAVAWKLAEENIHKAQMSQKTYYDKKAKKPCVRPGDRVMVHMPSATQGKTWKLARPFHGPYRVEAVTDTNAEVRLVDDPTSETIFVHLNRVRLCAPQQGGHVWVGPIKKRHRKKHSTPTDDEPTLSASEPTVYSGPMTRSRSRLSTD